MLALGVAHGLDSGTVATTVTGAWPTYADYGLLAKSALMRVMKLQMIHRSRIHGRFWFCSEIRFIGVVHAHRRNRYT